MSSFSPNKANIYYRKFCFSGIISFKNQIELDREKVYIWGSVVLLGYPLGATGARTLVTLVSVLNQNNGKYGVAGLCNGGGGASSVVVERLG